MARWAVEFYESEAEGCPVRNFLDRLLPPHRAKMLALIKLQLPPDLAGVRKTAALAPALPELRAHYGDDHYRVLYFGTPPRVFVLLHAIEKRTAEVAERDVVIAETRMQRYLGEEGTAR